MEVTTPLSSSNTFFIEVSGLSFIIFVSIGIFAAPIISTKYIKAYSGFTRTQQADWHTRVGSNVHAVIVTSIAIYCLIFDGETTSNPVWSQAVLVRSGIAITFGYITADLILIILSYRLIGDFFTLIHHLMAMLAYFFVVVYGVLPYFANFRQLAELSTVFVNQRWFYTAAKEPYVSRRFLANAWSMVISFFLCRLAVMPYYYYKCSQVWDTPERMRLGPLVTCFWLGTCVILDIINVFWMVKMIRGGYKVLNSVHKKRSS
ncbi:predicted protein [Nematostella vectensis]|uniref:TLC domain-containing protein n=1 Tax=Nematostella vectensis TaxID=45351 RepID=A7RW49_NEMVE|nr:predicted protein [Nematostella vectensis]|eukprot:XP_001636453.1 predicted protein [Nematostella vectensis]